MLAIAFQKKEFWINTTQQIIIEAVGRA